MSHLLTSERVKNEFNNIELIVISQDRRKRLSGFIEQKSKTFLTYHEVFFFDDGIKQFGIENHQKICNGASLGETIKNSQKKYQRSESSFIKTSVCPNIEKIFKTTEKSCISREVVYKIEGTQYAAFVEYFNPDMFDQKLRKRLV